MRQASGQAAGRLGTASPRPVYSCWDSGSVDKRQSDVSPLGPLTLLFGSRGDGDLRDFDVAPDGQRILTTRAAGVADGPARRLVLVENWQSGLAR